MCWIKVDIGTACIDGFLTGHHQLIWQLDDDAAPKYDPPRPFLNSSVLVGSGVYGVVVDGSISVGPFFATRGYSAKTDHTRGKFLRLLPHCGSDRQ